MADLKTHITTFNCGRKEVHVDYFASSLYSSFTSTSNPAATALPPDLIILALQELAPIGFSFLGGSLLASYFSRIAEAVLKATEWKYGKEAADYEHVMTRNVGMTGIMIFASRGVKKSVIWIEEAGTGLGVWEMGNKGAVGVRLGFEDGVRVTFVAAHLAPAEENWERRNEDWRGACERLVFERVEGAREGITETREEEEPLLGGEAGDTRGRNTLFHPPSYVFFAGDLNYRTADAPPHSNDHQSWPNAVSSDPDRSDFKTWFAQDQLSREMGLNKTLHSLAEAAITFPPTYKYSSEAQTFAADCTETIIKAIRDGSSSGTDETYPGLQIDSIASQNWLWAKHRVPSWCDRILYLANAAPTVHAYTALPVQPTSDHRPVVLSCSIPRKAPDRSNSVADVPFKIDQNWKQRRARARWYEFAVGLGAYLTLTGQGEALLVGSLVGIVGGYLVLAAVWGQS